MYGMCVSLMRALTHQDAVVLRQAAFGVGEAALRAASAACEAAQQV